MDNNLCSGEASNCITIIEPPKAAFKTTPALVKDTLEVCLGQTAYFDNKSEHADQYAWYFSDDLSKTAEIHPAHTFKNPGLYKITLVALSDCLCSDTTVHWVRVLDAKAPSLDCVGTICPGTTVTYTATGACAPYAWTVSPNGSILSGGTAQSDSITVQWNAGPAGTIDLLGKACSGAECPKPATTRIPILSDNAEIQGPAIVCPFAKEQYSIEAYGGTGFKWFLTGNGQITDGQGTNQIKVSWNSLIGSVQPNWLVVEYDNCYLGCKGRDSLAVRMVYPFVINGPVERCENATGNFTSRLTTTNQNLSCNWTLYAPDGSTAWTSAAAISNVAVPFNKGNGLYRLFALPVDPTLTCSARAEWTVNVAANPTKPTGITGERLVCPNTPYAYEATGGDPKANIQWIFQNGSNVSTTVKGNPQVISWSANVPRRLAAQQISSDGLGCLSDTVQISIQTLTAPLISGTAKVCEDATGQYSIPPQPNLDIQWKILPATAGTVAKGQGTNQAEIFWTQAGGHAVEVTVCGLKSIFPVTVPAPPTPSVIHPAGVCPGQAAPVQTATAFDTYVWKTAAGSFVSSSSTPQLGPGAYIAVVTDPSGCSATAAFNIDTFPTPNLSVTTADPTGFCNNERFVSIKALVTADGDYTYQWFQDGNPVGGNTQTFATNQYGLYTATVTNQFGCSASDGPIRVFEFCGGGVCHNPSHAPKCQPGDVGFSIVSTAPCDSFEFQLQAGPLYQPGSAFWVFGESGSKALGNSGDENPSFKFPNAGQYIVVLYATLTNGAQCTVLDSVNVEAVAKFSSDPVCAGSATKFKDVSTFLPGSGISNWQWDFGDPGSGASNNDAQRNPAHTFGSASAYPVTLTITANSGCTSSLTRLTDIPGGSPAAFAAPLANCVGNALEFNALAGPEVSSIRWDFGQASSGAANDAEGVKVYHNYTAAGTYTAKTTSTNVHGCTDVFLQTLIVSSNPLNGNITPAAPAPLCEGKSLTLTAPGGGTSWRWSDKTTTTPTLSVNKEGVYKVTITNANGCTYSPPPVKLDITPSPDALIKALVKNDFGQVVATAYPNHTVCLGEDVFLRTDGGVYGYAWSNGKNTRDIEFSSSRSNQLAVGTTVYTVTVTEFSSGCTAVTDPFTVTVNPQPSGFSIAGSSACAGKPLTLQYTGPTPANWQLVWNSGDKGPQLTTAAAGIYNIRVINEFGCSAKSNDWLVRSGPPVGAIPGGCHRRCKPDTLCLSNLPNVAAWQWFFDGTAMAGATTPNLVAQQNGTYWAELTDVYGCKAQSDPLTLDLYDGFGNVTGKVWSDVNNNGVVDAGDTLVSGIFINLLQNGTPATQGQSGGNGAFAFTNILSTNYTVQIDAGKLTGGWKAVIDKADLTLVGCNAKADCALLLRFDCQKVSTTLEYKACPNDSIPYQNTFVKTGSSRSFTLTNKLGCDSIVTVNVLPLATSSGSFTARACPGTAYVYNGVSLPVGSSQNFKLRNYLGCDSVVTVSVAPLPTSTGSFSVRVCPGDTYVYNGVSLSTGTTQDFKLQNYLGCDSIVTVSVSALPVSTGSVAARVCPGSAYVYEGVSVPEGSSRDFTLQNYLGCDSIVTVSVSALPVSTGSVAALVCPGGAYVYEGVSVPEGSSRDFKLKNYLGCDSIVTVSVSALPVSTGTFAARVCPGNAYVYNGISVPIGATQDFKLQNYLGCDSILTVSVSALPTSTGSFAAQVCSGGSYVYEGVSLPVGSSQNFKLQNYLGCDSIVTVSVTALPIPKGTFTTRACPGEVFEYEGVAVLPGETREVLVQNALGCDSIVVVTVAKAIQSDTAFAVSICAGGIYEYNNVDLRPGDVQTFALDNWQGCDSLVTVSISALPPLSGTFAAKVCEGEVFQYQGVTLLPGDNRLFNLRTAAGCDSIVNVSVRAVAKTDTAFSVRICPGSTFLYQQANLRPGDVKTFSLNNWQGCDSLVTISVTAPETPMSTLQKAVCKGDSYTFNNIAVAAGETRTFMLTGPDGCDSMVVLSVSALPVATFDLQTNISCPGTPTGSLTVQQTKGSPGPYRFSLDGQQFQDSARFVTLAAGQYSVFVKDSNNCVVRRDTQINALAPLRVELPGAVLACDSPAVRVTALVEGDTTALRYLWWNGSRTPVTFATEGGPVWLEVQNHCESLRREAAVSWGELEPDDALVYVPNIFKPDANEPGNAEFRPFFPPELELLTYHFEVYDRWGNRMFQSDQVTAGWEGVFRNLEMKPGVYVWFLEARVSFCGRELALKRKGDVTVLR